MIRRATSGECGSVAAELALALPAVLVTLLLGAGALTVSARQVALQDAAADAARLLGRGEDESAAQRVVSAAVPGAGVTRSDHGDLVCVRAQAALPLGSITRVDMAATSCALAGGL